MSKYPTKSAGKPFIKTAIDGAFCLARRRALGLNQADFWSPLGVTQSGGSRYESGRNIPAPTRKLIYLVHVVDNAAHLDYIAGV